MSVTFSITLHTRRMKAESGTYPVKLLVTHERNPRRYQTNFDLNEEEYNTLGASRISEKLQKTRDHLKQIKRMAEEITYALVPFRYEAFEQKYIYENPLFRQHKISKR